MRSCRISFLTISPHPVRVSAADNAFCRASLTAVLSAACSAPRKKQTHIRSTALLRHFSPAAPGGFPLQRIRSQRAPAAKNSQYPYRTQACEWYLAQKKLKWAADFEFALFPYLVNGIKNHLEDAYFRDMSGCELAEIEQAAGQKCQPIGHIGYYYPAEVWISEMWFAPAAVLPM